MISLKFISMYKYLNIHYLEYHTLKNKIYTFHQMFLSQQYLNQLPSHKNQLSYHDFYQRIKKNQAQKDDSQY